MTGPTAARRPSNGRTCNHGPTARRFQAASSGSSSLACTATTSPRSAGRRRRRRATGGTRASAAAAPRGLGGFPLRTGARAAENDAATDGECRERVADGGRAALGHPEVEQLLAQLVEHRAPPL